MKTRFQHKFQKELVPCLNSFVSKFADYVSVHPIPAENDTIVEFVPADVRDDFFDWEWSWKRSLKQICWQGLCDRWLRDNCHDLFLDEIKGVLIRIMVDDEKHSNDTNAGLIQGDGLASFHAVPPNPKYKMDRLILPKHLKEEILNTISIISNTELIYNVWGFCEIDTPRCILNFYGPPGTGKTMAAHAIADSLSKKIVVANFAEIESKYVGDSPKNLENIFTVAHNENAVLFFDEADSFLGKRLTSISSSSDQAVNSLRSKLLQLLDDYSGIVIFCTNLLKNYDKAFESRILRSMKFELPDVECRKRLIKQMIPSKIPFSQNQHLDENALRMLADASAGFSGRDIKNAVLQVLCNAASAQKSEFSIDDFKIGFDSARVEIENMKEERGDLDSDHVQNLEKKITRNLKKGDYKVQKRE